MRRGFVTFLVLLLVTAAPVLAQTESATAAKADEVQKTVNLDLKDVDVRDALVALFRNSGKNYAVDSNVSGNVPSLSLKDVPFETALRSLTKGSGLVFRVDNSSGTQVYIVSKKVELPAQPVNPNGGGGTVYVPPVDEPTEREVRIEKIPLQNTSASEMLAMLGGGTGREFGSMGYGGSGMGGYPGGMGSGYGMGGYPGGMGGGYGTGGYGGGYQNYGGGYQNYGGGGYGGYGGGYSSYGSGGYGSYSGNRSGSAYSPYRGW